MKVLITGGSGYIGSTIAYVLTDNDIDVVILDPQKCDSNLEKSVKYYCGNIVDADIINKIFEENNDIEYVIHCADKNSVALSMNSPYEYYQANVVDSIELFKNLNNCGLKKIIFSSSASMYDDAPGFMVTERSPIRPRSPFARSKHITEMILRDFCNAYGMECISLRYFNPIGADVKCRCGMNENTAPNIISRLINVMNGKSTAFNIAGDDWLTRDGTCLRDYIHIDDVALANLNAIKYFDYAFENAVDNSDNFIPLNIGSGVGVTVREFIFAFENVTGENIKVKYTTRRPGDIAGSYANTVRAEKLIKWKATHTVEDAIFDSLHWEEANGRL